MIKTFNHMEKLSIEVKLRKPTARVDIMDEHPEEPWFLCTLRHGTLEICMGPNVIVKRFVVCDELVRCAKFVPRNVWIIVGSDDKYIRIYDYNTSDLVHSFEAHTDYITNIAVHHTLPFIFTSSNDLLIKQWNWEENWACVQIYEGHSHTVMQLAVDPNDDDTFASGSLDETIKIWQIGKSSPDFTIQAHKGGVNCVSYHEGDKPFLISGGNDCLVKIWDYETRERIHSLDGHSYPVTEVSFQSELSAFTTSKKEVCKIWRAGPYNLEVVRVFEMIKSWTMTDTETTEYLTKHCYQIQITYKIPGMIGACFGWS